MALSFYEIQQRLLESSPYIALSNFGHILKNTFTFHVWI
jgi:hypothetical protein